MSIALLWLQVSATPPLPSIDFDLAKAKAFSGSGCTPGKRDEITVCGRRDSDRYRTKSIPGAYGDQHITAQASLPGNVTATAHGQATPLPTGGPPRFMLSLTKPF
ncbi:hypothetical protein FHS31_002292 [Sphingomonas vulcanisoli]|uniref:Uncharacterized protein n=1 Tax=Sphingomonas vulcanisoli TaxID=1658060 RepID=A0ABX0TT35_9SPHN|nr:hypothetical protein [Sphingomonas vulcanisoli]NIJ08671.1 hypothetical protein [Sphingomonas vulcanisoli]